MNEQVAQKQRYMVSIYEPEEAGGVLVFTFVPRGLQQEGGRGGSTDARAAVRCQGIPRSE